MPPPSNDPLGARGWTTEEDTELGELVEEYGEGIWARICELHGHGRTGKQCRERWLNHLRPGYVRVRVRVRVGVGVGVVVGVGVRG